MQAQCDWPSEIDPAQPTLFHTGSTDQMKRSQVLALIWALAVLGPLMNLVGVIGFQVNDNYWLVALTSPRDVFEVVGGIFAAFVMPAAPFIILGALGMQTQLDGSPSFGTGGITGSMIASIFAMHGGWLLLWIAVLLVGDGGASLGYWGFICSFPLFVPLAMLAGWSFGARWDT